MEIYGDKFILFLLDDDLYVKYEVEKDFADTVATNQVLNTKYKKK